MQGVEVEHFAYGVWCHSPSNYFNFESTYRIKPHELPITRDMWAMIDKKWKWVAMEGDGEVYFYTDEPYIHTNNDDYWSVRVGRWIKSILVINADGIDWRKSLTKRPEGV